ncbi:MAG: flavodoxin family protein [Lysobacteraceae bacterium]|nr:MAG: flavodoxin family protein [Xanthomonadaceae bacterium]
MGTRILIVQGHPDGGRQHLCHALAAAYADGARSAGHDVDSVEPARLRLPLLASQEEWESAAPPLVVAAQEAIRRAQHLAFFYPLWLGDMPAMLKGFMEQVARPGFAIDQAMRNPLRAGLLGGRSARLVVTMGMPALAYRWLYGAHSVRLMHRNILGFAGIAPVRSTIVGGAGALDAARAERWCARLHALGVAAR